MSTPESRLPAVRTAQTSQAQIDLDTLLGQQTLQRSREARLRRREMEEAAQRIPPPPPAVPARTRTPARRMAPVDVAALVPRRPEPALHPGPARLPPAPSPAPAPALVFVSTPAPAPAKTPARAPARTPARVPAATPVRTPARAPAPATATAGEGAAATEARPFVPAASAVLPVLAGPALQPGEYSTDRAHCPLCGMMFDLERLDDAPYHMDLFVQVFGGRVKPGTVHVLRSNGRVIDRTRNRRGSIMYFRSGTPGEAVAITARVRELAEQITARAEAEILVKL